MSGASKKEKKSKQPCANSPFPRSYYSSRIVKKGVLTSLNPMETRFQQKHSFFSKIQWEGKKCCIIAIKSMMSKHGGFIMSFSCSAPN